jgi:hypothetical protein
MHNIESDTDCLRQIKTIPMVAPMFSPNDLEIMKYSPPPSTRLLVASSVIAKVSECHQMTKKYKQQHAQNPSVRLQIRTSEREWHLKL